MFFVLMFLPLFFNILFFYFSVSVFFVSPLVKLGVNLREWRFLARKTQTALPLCVALKIGIRSELKNNHTLVF